MNLAYILIAILFIVIAIMQYSFHLKKEKNRKRILDRFRVNVRIGSKISYKGYNDYKKKVTRYGVITDVVEKDFMFDVVTMDVTGAKITNCLIITEVFPTNWFDEGDK